MDPIKTINFEDMKNEAEKISENLFNPRKCVLCRRNFAIASNLPRIMVQCGHSFCSICSENYIDKNTCYLTCPFCDLKLKNIKSSEDLPVNQKIFYYLQKSNKEKKNATSTIKSCQKHPDKPQKYICNIHKDKYCELCLKLHQTVEKNCEIFQIQNIRETKQD
jgi:hypothetical protein